MAKIIQCRICGGSPLELVIDLGCQALTGIFPRNQQLDDFPSGSLRLVRCVSNEGCGLVQLEHNFDPKLLYGENYGYRSGLNTSMVAHLRERVSVVSQRVMLSDGDVVIDIGSNDGTTLGFYSPNLTRIGIDPTAAKFREHYPPATTVVSDFFSASTALGASKGKKAKAITSFSMMYDLENPQLFVNEVAEVLASDGVWMFEQSYLPLMLERTAFDTICHEHLEYYGMRQIDWLLARSGLEAIDVELNDINGGSFSVIAAHKGTFSAASSVEQVRAREQALWKNAQVAFSEFAIATHQASDNLKAFVQTQLASGKTIAALGASTKGNVLLQFAGFTGADIAVIGEVNPDKYGCVTPGSWIPIVSQEEALRKSFDFYIVLPWHFRDFFLNSDAFSGHSLVFPLPILDIFEIK